MNDPIDRNEAGLVQEWLIDGITQICVRTAPGGATTIIAHADQMTVRFPALSPDTAERIAELLLASANDARAIHALAGTQPRSMQQRGINHFPDAAKDQKAAA